MALIGRIEVERHDSTVESADGFSSLSFDRAVSAERSSAGSPQETAPQEAAPTQTDLNSYVLRQQDELLSSELSGFSLGVDRASTMREVEPHELHFMRLADQNRPVPEDVRDQPLNISSEYIASGLSNPKSLANPKSADEKGIEQRVENPLLAA